MPDSSQSKKLSLPTDALIAYTAEQLLDYSLEVEAGDTIFLKVHPAAYELTNQVLKILRKRNIAYRIQNVDVEVDKQLLEALTLGTFPNSQNWTMEQKKAALFTHGPGSVELKLLEKSNKVLIIKERPESSERNYTIDAELEKESVAIERELINKRLKEHRWSIISVPTENGVRPADMSLEEYKRFYYKACYRPWTEVEEAQTILVSHLTGHKTLTIEVPPPAGKDHFWHTSLTMEIVGQVPANSVARRNMPGSEVFCAPNIHTLPNGERKGTLNGVLAIPNPVFFRDRIIPDIRLVFTDGQVTEWFTSDEKEDLYIASVLGQDEGARWAGEIGLGTNPKVTDPVPDTLLAEKSFGFHIALGASYTFTDYMGQKVNVSNGNESDNHIDLPRIMTPKFGGGTISVDGEVIMENGKYLDPRLAVLNI